MDRRSFVTLAGAAALGSSSFVAAAQAAPAAPLKPMELGLLIKPFSNPEATFQRVHDLGFRACFLSLDDGLGHFTPALAAQFRTLLQRYELTATTVEVVNPKPLAWNFLQGPSTIGLVPRQYRAARIAALQEVSDFAHRLEIPQVQTHCGFIPEDPADPLYSETVTAIRTVAELCQKNGQQFLMETGQETPTTMARALHDVHAPNLGVGLDTANLILYGKARPTDAVDLLGPHIRAIHAKDGRWPTNPDELGEEVLIGKGLVDFKAVFAGLQQAGYRGVVTIERETEGPQQIADVRAEKLYLENILHQLGA